MSLVRGGDTGKALIKDEASVGRAGEKGVTGIFVGFEGAELTVPSLPWSDPVTN